jgi:hypothetical protein
LFARAAGRPLPRQGPICFNNNKSDARMRGRVNATRPQNLQQSEISDAPLLCSSTTTSHPCLAILLSSLFGRVLPQAPEHPYIRWALSHRSIELRFSPRHTHTIANTPCDADAHFPNYRHGSYPYHIRKHSPYRVDRSSSSSLLLDVPSVESDREVAFPRHAR